MLNFFRKPPRELTFSDRVAAFWAWFREVAPRFHATIEAGECSSLADETSAKVNELLPGFCWVFGPREKGIGHSFTLTGEGNIHRQLLALEWLSRAPTLDGWTFYAARQPGPIRGHAMQIGDTRFEAQEIWVTPTIDRERECIDLTVWHAAWDKIDEGQRATVTYLFLDEALGEYGTDWWVGKVEYGRQRLAGAFPLEELPAFAATTSREHGWEKRVPGQTWFLMEPKSRGGGFPRSDMISQTTCVPRLIGGFLDAAGELADPIAGTGADYVYVSIDAAFFPKGEEVDTRSRIEEAVEAALASFAGGRLLGGALGTERGYCDFLIFDGERSLAAMKEALRAQRLPRGTMIEFFAREKRGRRIAL